MSKQDLMKDMTLDKGWQDLTRGALVYGEGNSEFFNTGEWRTSIPEWIESKCKQCLLCYPVCPDSSIPVKDSKRLDFDFDHCKGCGICVKACPFGAIVFHVPGKED